MVIGATAVLALLMAQPSLAQAGDEQGTEAAGAGRDSATKLNARAFERYQAGDYAGALSDFSETLRLRREVLGERHPDTLASLNNYALLLDRLGRASEAEPLFAEALQGAMRFVRDKEDLNADHPAVWAPFTLAGEGR